MARARGLASACASLSNTSGAKWAGGRLSTTTPSTREPRGRKYTTTCFVGQSARITTNDAYDENALPSGVELACALPAATAQQFFDAVCPAFHPRLSNNNWMALFNRAN
eukprot:6686367-Pyramimonas_sp.AAC.1